jgi:hypothetical protein
VADPMYRQVAEDLREQSSPVSCRRQFFSRPNSSLAAAPMLLRR